MTQAKIGSRRQFASHSLLIRRINKLRNWKTQLLAIFILSIVSTALGFTASAAFSGEDRLTINSSTSTPTAKFSGTSTSGILPSAILQVDDDGVQCPGAYTTIQAAMAAAAPGDTIQICSGTYVIGSTINLNITGLTLVGIGTKPVIQVAQAVGNLFVISASGVTLDNLEIQKTDVAGPQDIIAVQATDFTAKNNLIYGPNPGGTWNSVGIVSRAFVVSATTGLLFQNNVIHDLRQPAYFSGLFGVPSGSITGNQVSGTKGWVVEGGAYAFTGNTFGQPQNQDCDIALLNQPTLNPADYSPTLALSANNDNGFICAQYPGGEFGRATAYVDDSASPNGNGSDNDNYQSINAGIAGVLTGGMVSVASGGYNEDVAVNKSVTVSGAGFASTIVTGPIGGASASTFAVTANNVEIRGFTITRAGNNVAQWNDPNLNTAGVSVQGTSITGMLLHDNRIAGMRTAIDINNSNGHTIRNNVITDNRTGLIFRNQTDNLTVVENEITNNWTVGVLFIEASGGTNVPVQTAANCSFFNNNISGNWYGQIVDRQSGGSVPAPGTNLKNFSGNWYGTNAPVVTTANSTEPGYAALIPVAYGGSSVPPGGQPEILGPASANFDYSPFLNSGADTNIQTTPGRGTYGFQGSFVALNVSPTSPQAAVPAISSIQEAINLITAGGTLSIPTGVYPGDVNVNKALTLAGTFTIGGMFTTSSAGVVISPGFSPGIINSGNLSLGTGTTLNVELNGTTPGSGHDQLNVTGTVSIAPGVNLNTILGFTPIVGNAFTIINNDGSDPVSGTFNGLPEGTVFFIASNAFRISYIGGSNSNDVVLTSVSLCNTVSIPTNITALTGSTVTVPINVDDVTGHGLLSYDFTLTYDPAVVTPLVVDQSATLSSGMVITLNNPTPGTLIVSGFQSSPLSGTGLLLKVTFSAIGGIGTSSSLNLTAFQFNEGTPCLSTSNGLVTIISGSISGTVTYANAAVTTPVPNTVLSATGSINVTTNSAFVSGAYSLSGLGAGPYTVTPSKVGDVNGITAFDSARIAQHVVLLITLNATQLAAADVSGNNVVTSFDAALIARYVALLPGYGLTGDWKFIPVNRTYANVNTSVSSENYSGILMGEVSGNWIAPTSFAFGWKPEDPIQTPVGKPISISTGNVIATSGSNFTVPVTISNTKGRGIIAYQFDLAYDPDVLRLQPVPAELAGGISSGMSITTNSETPGLLRVVVFGASPLSGEGVLLNLKFTAIGKIGLLSPLTWQNVMLNEGQPWNLPSDGQVKIAAPTKDETSVSGRLLTPEGQGLGNTIVRLTNTRGESHTTLSNEFGDYRFGGVRVGESYTLSVESRSYRFSTQTISVVNELVNINLFARP